MITVNPKSKFLSAGVSVLLNILINSWMKLLMSEVRFSQVFFPCITLSISLVRTTNNPVKTTCCKFFKLSYFKKSVSKVADSGPACFIINPFISVFKAFVISMSKSE